MSVTAEFQRPTSPRPVTGPFESPPENPGHPRQFSPLELSRLDRAMRFLVRTRAGLWAPLLAYAITLAGPFVLDDVYMIRRIERYRAGQLDNLDLFRFVQSPQQLREQRDRTSCPWWMGGGATTNFLRPFAQTVFVLDNLLFDRSVLGYRLVSFTWFLLVLALVRRLYYAAGASPVVAEIATLLFGIAQPSASPAAFISNRSDLLALVGLTVASVSFWSAQSAARNWRRWLPLAALALVFALLSKEAAVPIAAVWLAHAWLERARRGSCDAACIACRRRWTFAILAALLAAGYLAYYAAAGYGTHVAGITLTDRITHQFSDSARTAALLLPVWTMGFPAILLYVLHQMTLAWILAILSIGLLLLIAIRARAEWRDSSTFRFFALWTMFMSLPVLLASPEPRVLCIATVGWAYIIARLFYVERRPATRQHWPILRHSMQLSNGGLTLICGVITVMFMQHAEAGCRDSIRAYLAAQPRPLRENDALVVTQPRQLLELLAPGDRFQLATGLYNVRLHYLTVDPDIPVKRIVEDDHTLLLTSDAPAFFNGILHPLCADDGSPLHVGATWQNRDFTAEIVAMQNGRITALRAHFTRPLNSPDLLFYPPLK